MDAVYFRTPENVSKGSIEHMHELDPLRNRAGGPGRRSGQRFPDSTSSPSASVHVSLAAVSHYSGVESHDGPEYAGFLYGARLLLYLLATVLGSWRSVDGFNAFGSGALDRG